MKTTFWIDNVEISLFPDGTAMINTHYWFEDSYNKNVFATTDTYMGERFSWTNSFIYEFCKYIGYERF